MPKNNQNVVGPQIRRLRDSKELTQEQLVARCNVLGWDLSRSTLAKIEAQVRCVTDVELHVLARALKTGIDRLYPSDSAAIISALN